MENHREYDELLAKYLLNELSKHEELKLVEWIKESDENRNYFEQVKAAWNLAAARNLTGSIDIEEEWSYYQRVVKGGEMIMNFPHDEHDALIETSQHSNLFAKLWKICAVAAMLVIIFATIVYLSNRTLPKADVAANTPPAKDSTGSRNALIIKTERNLSGTPKTIQLGDGSQVMLYANSELRYSEHFTGGLRSVRLKGKADFDVAKDRAKPFIVYHGEISTTVLGTKFTVVAYDNTSVDVVKLYEGKVLIKSTEEAVKQLKEDYYLEPGQELLYDKETGTAFIRSFREKMGKKEQRQPETITVPDDFKGSWVMFNNQPLAQVFDQLGALYNVEIKYKDTDINKMYFIGRFDERDSIENILKHISVLHQLTLTRDNNKYIISR